MSQQNREQVLIGSLLTGTKLETLSDNELQSLIEFAELLIPILEETRIAISDLDINNDYSNRYREWMGIKADILTELERRFLLS